MALPIQVIEIIISYIPNSFMTIQNIFLLSKKYYRYLSNELNIDPIYIFNKKNIIITIHIHFTYDIVNKKYGMLTKKYNKYINKNNQTYNPKNRRDRIVIQINDLNKLGANINYDIYKSAYNISESIINVVYEIENNLFEYEAFPELTNFNISILFVDIPIFIEDIIEEKRFRVFNTFI